MNITSTLLEIWEAAEAPRQIEITLDEGVEVPKHAKPGDAGLDLRAKHGFTIYPGQVVKVDTGVRAAIPVGFCGILIPRSGLGTRGLVLANTVGLIDSTYRGPIVAALKNTSNDEIKIEAGERIVQLVVMPHLTVSFNVVDSLPETERGEGGFGHSGTN